MSNNTTSNVKDAFERIEGMTGHVRDYVHTRIEQTKLEIAEKTSSIVGNLIAGAVVAVLFLFVLVFGSIAGAYALGIWLDNIALGFLIVMGVYLLLGIIIWLARGPMIRFPVMNAIIRQLHKKEKDDHETTESPN